MSFWNLSTNETLSTDGSFESSTNFDPIPANTALKAMITEASWDEYNGDRYINIRWDVIDGEYKGRIVFQKVRCADVDAKKRDKAIRMLAAIDANAGGKLMALGREPSDMDLAQCLLNKPMWIKVQVWELEDKSKSGNWVSAVSGGGSGGNGGGKVHTPAREAKPKEEASPGGGFPMDDDIPFAPIGLQEGPAFLYAI